MYRVVGVYLGSSPAFPQLLTTSYGRITARLHFYYGICYSGLNSTSTLQTLKKKYKEGNVKRGAGRTGKKAEFSSR